MDVRSLGRSLSAYEYTGQIVPTREIPLADKPQTQNDDAVTVSPFRPLRNVGQRTSYPSPLLFDQNGDGVLDAQDPVEAHHKLTEA